MDVVRCELCGEPMPPGETMFKYHGYSGPCPGPAIKSRLLRSATPPPASERERHQDATLRLLDEARLDNAALRRKVEASDATVHELWDELNKTQGDRDRFRGLAERLAGACEAVLCNCEDCRDDTMICDTCQKRFAALSDYRAAVKESGTP